MELVGWSSSVILLCTIVYQVYNHWRAGDNGGVSLLLYVGQLATSMGFTTYSVSVGNWVFVVTNALLLVAAVVGILIHRRNERLTRKAKSEAST